MISKYYIGIIAVAATLQFFNSSSLRAQNSYPASGDAKIHTLTIGTGPGAGGTTNTALGDSALFNNINGSANVAVGYTALALNTYGNYNTAVGFFSLHSNTSGYYNTGIGFDALSSNTTGIQNTAYGPLALTDNISGSANVGIGQYALEQNTTGSSNVGLGTGALTWNVNGSSNVAVGFNALHSTSSANNLVAIGDSSLANNTGSYNTALGSRTLAGNSTGIENTALGYQGLYMNNTGSGATAAGYQALYSNQNGQDNSAFGLGALYGNTSGSDNVATGVVASYSNTTGSTNTSSGLGAMYQTTSGSSNAAFGVEALFNNTTGTDNTALGAFSGTATGNLTNATAVGYDATTSASNSVAIGNSSVTSIGGYAPWTNFSDGRYKRNITQNVPGLAFINKLAPVTYTLDVNGIETRLHANRKSAKGPDGRQLPDPMANQAYQQAMKEKSQIVYTGFVAQDVEKAAQSVGYNFSGVDKPKDDQSFYGLRYSDFVVPLVKAAQELSRQNDSLKSAVDSLTAANALLNSRVSQIEQHMGIGSNGEKSEVLSLSSAKLFQNSPNPFSQSTLINYYVPQNTGVATLQITDMNGAAIKTVAVSGSGYGQLRLQTDQLAGGTYIYSLLVDGRLVDSKKMVVAK